MSLIERTASRLEGDARVQRSLETALRDGIGAIDIIAGRLATLSGFATLEGPALADLAPSFTSGLAHAICAKTAGE